MGRFYTGSIEGKFWFACQSSSDVENICSITYTPRHYYNGCGCFHELNYDKPYCVSCFENIEDHRESIISNGGGIKDSEKLWELNEDEISYYIDEEEHLEEVQATINELEAQIGQYIEILTFGNKDENYEYYIEISDSIKDLKTEERAQTNALIARYCLARQIELCLIEQGNCFMECEC